MSNSRIKRFGRRCQLCGFRRRSTATRTVKRYTTKVYKPNKKGEVYAATKTNAMVCDDCEATL